MDAPPTAPSVEPAPLTPEEVSRLSLAQLGARVMVEQLDRVLRHEPGTRLGEDPEELHKMRVATRRLRVAFKVFGKALAEEGIAELPEAEVKEVAGALGGVRDLDVFAEWLKGLGQAMPGDWAALERLRSERLGHREAARAEMLRVLDGTAMAALKGQLRERLWAIGEPAFLVPGAGVKKGQRVARAGKALAHRALKRLRRKADLGTAATADELHEVRIAAKRFRYVCEFLEPAFGPAVTEPIDRATAVQDALGEAHDADVAEAALLQDIQRLADGEHCADAGAVARLVAAQRARREGALEAFREAWAGLPPPKWLKKVDVKDLPDDIERDADDAHDPPADQPLGDGAQAGDTAHPVGANGTAGERTAGIGITLGGGANGHGRRRRQ